MATVKAVVIKNRVTLYCLICSKRIRENEKGTCGCLKPKARRR